MKRFIAFFIICSFLTAAVFYNQPKRYPDGNYRINILKYMATAGRDSVFTLSFDSLKMYLRNQGFSDTLSLIDTLAALKVRTSTQIHDSLDVLKPRTAKQIHDSLGQAIVVIPNDIKIKGNDLTFGNGASISNASADTARVTETAVKIEGKLVNFNDYVSHSIATNTILGITAGEDLTSGFSNTFTGWQAGKNVTSGYVNSVYGADAGESITTGFHNNLVGFYAGAGITTGKYNNFFGSETGLMLTKGEHNTIMGHHAMLGTLGDAGTASYNTAIGANSCYKVATGIYNATLGFRAMGSGDGNYNTMLGAYTGYSNPGNIGDRNVFIGYRAGSRCLTASDSLIIASEDAVGKQEIFKGSFADSSLIATGKFTIEGDELAFGSGASITNPSSGILSLNSSIVSIPADSTNITNVLRVDTLTDIDIMQFNIDFVNGIKEGKMQWCDSLGTAVIGLKGSEINLPIGQKTVMRCKSSSGTILKGSVVYIGYFPEVSKADDDISGGSGNFPEVAMADADIYEKSFVAGIADTDLDPFGYITLTGYLTAMNTNEMTLGLPIWLSQTEGAYTQTRPEAPAMSIFLGYPTRISETEGTLVIRPTLVPRLSALSDTYGTPTDDGQFYTWDTTDSRFELSNIKVNADNIVMPNGAEISNAHADTLKITEANTIIDGNLKVNGTQTTLKNGITFTTYGDSLAIAGGNYLAVRTPFNVNPYISAYTGATYGWRFSNTLIGVHSGKSGMTGNHNICIGDSTGIALTSGHKNVFIGGLSSRSNTTGVHNVVMGYQAGSSIASGYESTIIGSLAGANTTGTRNTYIGFSSGYRSNGTYNTFVGDRSGYGASSSATGSNNSAFGRYSLFNNSTGGYNSAFGVYSLFKNSTGGYNSAFGVYSLLSNTTGSYGVALGDSAGYTNTTGSRNVFIGYKAIGTSATASDQFILQSDNGSNVQRLMQGSFADSSLTINGNLSYKKPFGKFHRIYTQTPANPNAWENIRWNEKHAETTSHFTATADSQGVIISKAGIYAVRCVSKMLWTGSAATTVSSYFRLWQGKGAAITKELRTSQHTSVKEQNTSNANDEFFWGSRYFAAGDTVYAQWRTSNVGNLIQGSAIFANPTSASIEIEYIKER